MLSLLVLSLTLPSFPFFLLLFSQKVSELQARASAHYTEHVPYLAGRTLIGNVCRGGCCWRCPRVDIQGSCSGGRTSPATLQKQQQQQQQQKNRTNRKDVVYVWWSFIECSTSTREASFKNLALWRSTSPKGSQLDGWGVGLSLQRGVPSRCWCEYWAIQGTLGWGMFAGRGKFSREELLFAVPAVCDSLRFGRGTWCSPGSLGMCRVDGRWNTNLGENCAGLRSGKRRRTASFLSGGRGICGNYPLYTPVTECFCEIKFLSVHVRMRCNCSSMCVCL